MDLNRDTFHSALFAVATPNHDISEVLAIIETSTEAKPSTRDFVLQPHIISVLNSALERLVIRLPNDEENMGSILSILNYFCSISCDACIAVRRFCLLEHVGKLLKSRRHEEIINTCLELIDNLCRLNTQFIRDIVVNESNLNIVDSIVHILWLVLEKDVPSQTTLRMSFTCLHKILVSKLPPQKIIDEYRIVRVVGYAIVKFIDDWKTSKKNHKILFLIMLVLELCSQYDYKNLSFELKNTGGGDAMLLLSDLIVIFEVNETVTNIVLNLQRHYIHCLHVPLDDIYSKMIEKLQDPNTFTNEVVYSTSWENLGRLLNAESIPENSIVTAMLSLLNALKGHLQPTLASIENCQKVIATLQLPHFERYFRLMLDCGILSILSSKLDWFFGVENQLDLHHDVHNYDGESRYKKMFERQFYGNLDTSHAELNAMRQHHKRKRSPSPRQCAHDNILMPTCSFSVASSTSGSSNQETDDDELDEISADINSSKRKLARKIVNLIDCFANLKPAVLELGTSDTVYKLLLFFLPKNESIKPSDLMLTITNIITNPKHLINLLMQTQFVYMVSKLCIPKHSRCLICIDLFKFGRLIMKNLTKVVESTIEKGEIAHNLNTASPTIKQTLVVALPFFSEKMSTIHNLMIKCGGLDVLIDAFQRETAHRKFISCSLKVLLQKIQMKDPTECTDHFDFDDEVTTVLEIENYQPSAGRLVTFKLDDDSCLQANRELLASKSEFFNSMLFGQFKESNEEVVSLPETPHNSFKLILMLLQLDDTATDDKLCRNGGKLLEGIELPVILKAICLCDQFLLKELYMSLMLYMQHCKFSPEVVPIIYRWLVDSPTHVLHMEIVAYCLVGYMSEEQRNCLFEELLMSEFSEQLVEDMKNMFRSILCTF